MASCPYYNTATSRVSAISCAVPGDCNSNTYNDEYSTDGTAVVGANPPTTPATDILGYDTTLTLSRVCVPNPNMFTVLFKNLADTFSSALSQGALADFINDTKNVRMGLCRIGIGCWLRLEWPLLLPLL